ncbi:hypothetical protein FXG79_12130 [Salmonella enterica]|uniref:Uncharacterized protein n=1 Tax=Salmonella enterica subsp. diarizonae serovar 48:i:z TaxID=1192842 RepID=A0A735RC93_SALDZ|nr:MULTISPECIES: hypothetical protein [Salmonella]EAO1480114.1 hypothetical protein [Salmonella enterica]EBP3540203.1 hypothetical protein [Salmonella enterica subsp. enterica]ECF2804370.1 hypothetical protein [Salmonella enterica subsp. enterica serovar Miami]ECG3433390.1 hypothetical protein [Salmonella enterica subsp. enterica serovar Oranienburg]ECN0437847.1 hypothetical protein [Salmonella enterica subsp. enterica serovar Newport]ECY7784207.1 hypothetical protein [Salmonella enterica sub
MAQIKAVLPSEENKIVVMSVSTMQIAKTFTIFSASRGLGKNRQHKIHHRQKLKKKNSIKTEDSTSTP